MPKFTLTDACVKAPGTRKTVRGIREGKFIVIVVVAIPRPICMRYVT